MSNDKKDIIQNMLLSVAKALGSDLLENMAFLGGCATGLHVTDAVTMNVACHPTCSFRTHPYPS